MSIKTTLMGMMLSMAPMAAIHAQHTPGIEWDSRSLIVDGRRVVPVMGEVHYSRIPQDEWASELRKMKAGGVSMIATYVFWNHVEEEEGRFDWSGQRSLRTFIEMCKDEGLPVIVRLGPFCHGEARNGGIPDWVFRKVKRTRQTAPDFMALASALYRQIYTQVQGLQWKDGGPVVAVQFDNEYRGSGDYLMALKKAATEIGFDLPFYTRTGWPELSKPVPFGEMLPLYGDYADGFWERSTREGAGNYWKAFHFKAFRSSTAIATEQLGEQKERLTKGDADYPYFTCELGGGMMTSYHRRVYMYPQDAYAMAVVKLGSGSNLLGYYMYHGGTNPESHTGITLEENQRTKATNYNDMPVKNYDFQAPLGEFGQPNETYYTLRKLHRFMADFGSLLAPMDAHFPHADKEQKQGDDSYLRWSYREKDGQGFVFFSNYERFQGLTAKRGVQFKVSDRTFPRRPITIPAGAIGVLPYNISWTSATGTNTTLGYATAQLMERRGDTLTFVAIPGVQADFEVDGKLISKVKPGRTFYSKKGLTMRLVADETMPAYKVEAELAAMKVQEPGAPRTITIGVNKAAESPSDADFRQAAVYSIDLTTLPDSLFAHQHSMLQVQYAGDCARLYADGRLIADNFYNGRPMLMGLWRLPAGCRKVELRVLPQQKDAPIYWPKEATRLEGEKVEGVSIVAMPGIE